MNEISPELAHQVDDCFRDLPTLSTVIYFIADGRPIGDKEPRIKVSLNLDETVEIDMVKEMTFDVNTGDKVILGYYPASD